MSPQYCRSGLNWGGLWLGIDGMDYLSCRVVLCRCVVSSCLVLFCALVCVVSCTLLGCVLWSGCVKGAFARRQQYWPPVILPSFSVVICWGQVVCEGHLAP